MKKLAVFALVALLSGMVTAETLVSDKETKELSDKIMAHITKAEFQEGFNLAKPYYPIQPVELDSFVNEINREWPSLSQRYGKVLGNEFIRSERIGGSFIRYIYLQKFEKHAMAWEIKFYRSGKDWTFNGGDYTSNIDFLFSEPK